MVLVAAKLVLLAAGLVPVLLGLLAAWGRHWGRTSPADALLAAMLCVPAVTLAEVYLLNVVPVDRPLDHLIVAHAAVCVGGLGAAWRLRTDLGATLAGLRGGSAAGWREAGGLGRAIVVLGVVSQVTALAYGSWQSAWTWDDRSYHIPQALQPFQDGRLAAVRTAVQWADSYPRGASLLYFWTLRLTGTDAGFNATSAAFGFLFMGAVYGASRRMGIGRRWSLIAAAATPTAPIFFYLSTIAYIDLIVGAVLACALTFALPERDGRWSWGSAGLCLLAVLLGLWMKVTAAPVAAIVLGVRWVASFGRRRGGAAEGAPGPAGFAAASLVTLALAAVPYARSWLRYGSPTYPQELRLGPLLLFEGPMWAGSYLPVDIQKLTWQQKWVVGWTDWFRWLQVDSPGGYGPLFTLAMVPAAAACALGWAWARGPRRLGWLILALSFWGVLAIPAAYVPRYVMWVLLPGAVCAGRIGEAIDRSGREAARGWAAAVLVMQAANILFIQRCFVPALRQYLDYSERFGVPLLTRHRTRPLQDRWERLEPHGPTPETRRALYELMRRGERLITAVDGWHSTFYDPDYRYAVEHRPVRSWGFEWPTPGAKQYPLPEAPQWLAGLRRDGVDAAMVYKGSPEDLELAKEGSGFGVVYEQPPGDGVVIRIYRVNLDSRRSSR